MSLTDEFSLTGSVLLKNLKESAYASLIIVMYSSPNCSTMVSPIPVAWRSEWLFYNQSVSTKRIFIYHYKSQTFQENIWQHMIFFLDHGWNCQSIVVCSIADVSLTPQWQSSERNLPVTIVQKLDIFYSGILNLEFPNSLFNF